MGLTTITSSIVKSDIEAEKRLQMIIGWTRWLTPDVRRLGNKGNREVNFHPTQASLDMGNFREYLFRLKTINSLEWWFCGIEIDYANHTFIVCNALVLIKNYGWRHNTKNISETHVNWEMDMECANKIIKGSF